MITKQPDYAALGAFFALACTAVVLVVVTIAQYISSRRDAKRRNAATNAASNTPSANTPSAPVEFPNRYVFGKWVFAEYVHENDPQEQWQLFWKSPMAPKPGRPPEICSTKFFTDTEENMRTLMKLIDEEMDKHN